MYYGVKRAMQLVNEGPPTSPPLVIARDRRRVRAPGGDLGGRSDEGETRPGVSGADVLPFLTIRDSPAPVIAAVNGICQAGGLLIAMMADVAVASDRATFRVPELLRGIPDATYAAALPAHVGIAVARDLLLTGRSFDAAEALRFGLLSRVVPHDDLVDATVEAAHQVLRTAPNARAQVKRMINERYGTVDYQTMFWAIEHSPELRDGMRRLHGEAAPTVDPRRRAATGPHLTPLRTQWSGVESRLRQPAAQEHGHVDSRRERSRQPRRHVADIGDEDLTGDGRGGVTAQEDERVCLLERG